MVCESVDLTSDRSFVPYERKEVNFPARFLGSGLLTFGDIFQKFFVIFGL